MKKYLCPTLMVLILLMSAPAYSSIINGGFESGRFDGWALDIPLDISEYTIIGEVPAGSAEIIDEFIFEDVSTAETKGIFPVKGDYFAALGTGDIYSITSGPTHITAKQRICLNEGDSVSGWVSFYNGDFEVQDSGWINIEDIHGAEIANVWHEYSGAFPSDPDDPNTIPYMSASNWTYWEWVAPYDDIFALVLGVSTGGDNAFSSYAFYDDIHVTSINVPEPSTIILLLTGIVGLIGLGRKKLKEA